MKKAICSFLSICLLIPFLLFPQSIQANEKKGVFEFFSTTWDHTEDDSIIPSDESWYLFEHADVRGHVSLPFISNEEMKEYEVVGIETDRPDVFETLQVDDQLFPIGGNGPSVGFYGTTVKDEYFTITITIKKGDETLSFTSQPHIYKQKSMDLHICAGPETLTSMEELFALPEASEFKLDQMYYIYATIDGYNQNLVETNYNVFVNDQELRYTDVYKSDEAMFYGFNDYIFMRSAAGRTATMVAFKAYKDTEIDVVFKATGLFGGAEPSSDPLSVEQHYTFSNAKDMQDETGNVEVSAGAGVLPSDASLQVKPHNDDVLVNAMKEIAEQYQAYDISILSNEQPIQPNGMVKVRIKIPAGFEKEMISIYYVDKEGNLTLLKSTIDGEYIEFETNHFSVYAIVEEKQNDSEIILPPAEVGGGEDTSTPSTDKDDPMKKTDMQDVSFPISIIFAIMMISAWGIYFLRKRVKE